MSCEIIPPSVTNPFLHNNIIQKLQTAMETTGFISQAFPLAKAMDVEYNNRRGIVPVIYGEEITNPNNYIQMFPDKAVRGISFFEIQSGDYKLDRGTEDGDLIDIIVRIVVTANLHNLANRTYDFTDELIAGTVVALENSELNQDIESITIVTDTQRVFEKYTYTFNELQSLVFPMTGFAIDLGMKVNYDFDCVVPSTFSDSYSPEC